MNSKVIVGVVGLLLATGCVDRAAQKQAAATEKLIKDPAVAVQVQTAALSNVEDTIEITGSIETSDDANATAIVGGPLVAVYVKDGDQVRTGQVIAKQDDSDYRARVSQAQAQVQAAKAALEQAKADALIGPTKSEAQVKASQARLDQSKARLDKLVNGSRPEERKRAEAQVQKAKSDLDTAKSALDRAKRLYKEGAISEADLEQAQNTYSSALSGYDAALQDQRLVQQPSREEDIAAAREDVSAAEQQLAIDKANKKLDVLFTQRVDSAQANYDAAKQNLALTQIALDNTVVRAPFDGRISGKPTQVGTYVAPGVSVAHVVGIEGAYFEAQVPESEIAKIQTGMSVEVSVDALPGEKTSGQVMAINPQATTAGRLFYVRVQLTGDLPGLKSGMFARGNAKIGMRDGVILLPSTSLVVDGENAVVFLADGSKAKRVSVKTGETKDGMTEVSGISPGDQVIVRGQESLADGSEIKVEKAGTSKGA